ncbi:GNAT family N-acetyltransferase [bacterium]|nr:GNAT family N-acetyltransferase [bacterium]
MLYAALFVPQGRKPFPANILEEPKIKKYIQAFGERRNDLAIVACLEDELVGAVWGRIFRPPDVGFGFVDVETPEIGIAVKSEYRTWGIGTRLLEEISTGYLKRDIKAISLSVDKRNPAKALYAKMDFQVVEDKGPDFIMKKELDKKRFEKLPGMSKT